LTATPHLKKFKFSLRHLSRVKLPSVDAACLMNQWLSRAGAIGTHAARTYIWHKMPRRRAAYIDDEEDGRPFVVMSMPAALLPPLDRFSMMSFGNRFAFTAQLLFYSVGRSESPSCFFIFWISTPARLSLFATPPDLISHRRLRLMNDFTENSKLMPSRFRFRPGRPPA